MKSATLLKVGIIGTAIAALCCFTPVLVILLGVLGLSAWSGHWDAVLLPALGVFVVILIYALMRKASGKD
ncbi:MAG: mercury resistance system transport protein MerF [Gallionella sp.]